MEQLSDKKPLLCRGVRGATTVEENSADAILKGTRELLTLMIQHNDIRPEDVTSAWFTTTRDLNAEFPALAARQLHWMNVALICGNEMEVPKALKKCIRILIHWNTTKSSDEIVHVYIKDAAKLRPDKDALPPVNWEELNQEIEKQMSKNFT